MTRAQLRRRRVRNDGEVLLNPIVDLEQAFIDGLAERLERGLPEHGGGRGGLVVYIPHNGRENSPPAAPVRFGPVMGSPVVIYRIGDENDPRRPH